jgi:hypothetical protein
MGTPTPYLDRITDCSAAGLLTRAQALGRSTTSKLSSATSSTLDEGDSVITFGLPLPGTAVFSHFVVTYVLCKCVSRIGPERDQSRPDPAHEWSVAVHGWMRHD